MELPSKIRFANEKVKESFNSLENGKFEKKKLFSQLVIAFEEIENNAFCGIQIPKKLIPKEYKTNNLWKYNLPNAWRLLYSIENQEIVIVAIVLEWLTHKEYEKKFNY
jgi:Txe/YoeB family toxin of Txe-Axe toxin-antitoxin module